MKNSVSLAMWRDGSSGGVIRTVTISKDGVERDMIEVFPRTWNNLKYFKDIYLKAKA